MARMYKRVAVLTVTAVIAGVAAGCGSSSSGAGKSTGTSTAAPGSGTAAAGVTYAKSQMAKFSGTSDSFTPPGPEIDVSSLKGKTMWYIPISSQIPVFAIFQKNLEDAAKAAGLRFQLCDAQGNPTQLTSCLNQALADNHAAGIVNAGAPYSLAANAFQQVWKAGLPLVMTDTRPGQLKQYGDNPPASVGYVGYPADPVDIPARLASDAIIADSNGKAHVLTLNEADGETQLQKSKEGIDEFKQHCPDCVVTTIDTSVTTLKNLSSEVAAALLKDPQINYVQAWADLYLPSIADGARHAGRKLKMSTTSASLAGMQELSTGQDGIFYNAGWSFAQEYWMAADVLYRLALNQKPDYSKYVVPVRAFDQATAKTLTLTEDAATSGAWYGDPAVFTDGFKQLWGVK